MYFVESCKIRGGRTMKSTGVVRRVDELGRIVIPIELRRTLDIAEKDALEIYVDGEQIILKKYEPACIFCGDARDIISRIVAMSFCEPRSWTRVLSS